jgi:hypothetical protein
MFNYYNIVFNLYDLIHEGINIINTYNFEPLVLAKHRGCEDRKKEIAKIVLEYEQELIEELIEKFRYYWLWSYVFGYHAF